MLCNIFACLLSFLPFTSLHSLFLLLSIFPFLLCFLVFSFLLASHPGTQTHTHSSSAIWGKINRTRTSGNIGTVWCVCGAVVVLVAPVVLSENFLSVPGRADINFQFKFFALKVCSLANQRRFVLQHLLLLPASQCVIEEWL